MKNFIYFLKKTHLVVFSLFSIALFAQKKDTIATKNLDEVIVKSIRANEKTPVPFTNFSKSEIEKRNLGQDIPALINFLPSVVTTSDAGASVGYTGIRVRGSDATRVNVTINGIPYNDSESQGTYFVDMPDFASSVQSIQLQRGVGTSTNGAAAFGASLNILTDASTSTAGAEISNSYGSFNTHKHTLKFNTGLLNNSFEISGRISSINSDGYIDRAKSDLKSYFLQANYFGKTSRIKALLFGGKEITYQSWYGVDAETLKNNRTYNYAGIYIDSNGETQFYDNQVDDYSQTHCQLHWNEKIAENWDTNLAFHYTKGKGFYEEYQENQNFVDYGLNDVIVGGNTISQTNLVRRKWLDNDFYGLTFSSNYKTEKLNLIFGGAANKYEGLHYGQIIWGQFASNGDNSKHYYNNFATKTDAAVFVKANFQITEKWNLFGDLQVRNLNYKANGVQTENINENFSFFNPKAGLTFSANNHSNLYFSFAIANREPNRTDYENGNPKPEKLDDYELGWRFENSKSKININAFYMNYQNQLVLTGALDNVGNPIRKNSGKSYRLGLEADAKIELIKKWILEPNISISENKNIDFINVSGNLLQNLGNTNISFSPKIVSANRITFMAFENFQMAFLSKFVGEQFLSNLESQDSKLNDYFIQDLNLLYVLKSKHVFKTVQFSLLANNLFNVKHVSNGADYGGGYVYYFPQAGSHFLAGITLKF